MNSEAIQLLKSRAYNDERLTPEERLIVARGYNAIATLGVEKECCDTGMDAPHRYVKTDTGDCDRIFGGTVVTGDHCPQD